MLLAQGSTQTLGSEAPRLAFGDGQGRRALVLDGEAAFELSFWCGTCPFLFERLEGAKETLSLSVMEDRLAAGLGELDGEVVETFGALLPRGSYLPLLLEIEPRLVLPVQDGRLLRGRAGADVGPGRLLGPSRPPHTPYYRTFETAVDAEAHLYEFVVPMVPPSWNDAGRVAEYAERLRASSSAAAVAVTTLDVCAPAVAGGSDWYMHWGLTHFLLDGHHKLQAAAENGRRLRLLALVSVEGSLADDEQLGRVAKLRDRRPGSRSATSGRFRARS